MRLLSNTLTELASLGKVVYTDREQVDGADSSQCNTLRAMFVARNYFHSLPVTVQRTRVKVGKKKIVKKEKE